MAIDCGQGIGGCYIGLYLGKIPTLRGWRAEKKRKFLQRWAAGEGIGAGTAEERRRSGGGGVVVVLVVVMVRNKSKTNYAPLSIVLF